MLRKMIAVLAVGFFGLLASQKVFAEDITPLFDQQQTDAFWDGAAKVGNSEALFDACQVADGATTIWALSHGFTEVNPILTMLGVGAGAGYVTVVVMKGALIGLIHWLNPPDLKVANAVSCGVALHNLWMIF